MSSTSNSSATAILVTSTVYTMVAAPSFSSSFSARLSSSSAARYLFWFPASIKAFFCDSINRRCYL